MSGLKLQILSSMGEGKPRISLQDKPIFQPQKSKRNQTQTQNIPTHL